jgi:uncharacterized protein (DUF488 family)
MPPIFTIGHSTRTPGQLLALLKAHNIERLADVRTIPRSRRNPQFNADVLPAPLAEAGILYVPMPELGGLRHPRKDSPNTAWQNESFRGYADYMLTPQFEAALARLVEMARTARVAIMCAEAVPWRCHRSLIADALTARGIPVEHITSEHAAKPHRLTPFAKVEGRQVTYPGLLH